MKKYLSILVLSVFCMAPASADEGMWLPSLISQRIGDMQAKGFTLTAEDIYSINQACLKDAVVHFGGGCTGELISPEGLLITNHHCGYGQIQRHSSVEHDYLRDGFWAMTRAEELPNPGLSVSFLEYMEDVTDKVLKGYKDGMSEEEREALVEKNSAKLVEEAVAEGKGLRASVEPLFYGNKYYMFVFRRYTDVRLVGAPPSSIGKFGGDTDNWMWPRHTGDFSIFRVYADKDNNPAAYSEDNVPYKPKKYFHIAAGGVKEGDFTFVYGFPGSTREYIMSEGVRYVSDVTNPAKIALRTMRLDVQKKYMDADQAVRIQYSSKNAGVSNAWKKWQGEMKGIVRLGTVARKQAFEASFMEWAEGTEYEGIIPALDSLYKALEPYNYALDYYNESARTIELVQFASRAVKAAEGGSDSALKAVEATFYKDYFLPIDKESFVAVMNAYKDNVPVDFRPPYFDSTLAVYGGSIEKWADDLFSASVFADRAALEAMDCAAVAALQDDPAVVFGREFTSWIGENIRPVVSRLNSEINLLNRDYVRGQMEFQPEKTFYPDANSTLRVAYGHIKGYSPSDGVYYMPFSTIEGIMEKDNPDIFDYNIPQRFRDIVASGDYGRWGHDGKVPVCFIATNHTSGGNSGSPVIDSKGRLIGINFDRVWEGTMSDIEFDPDFCRNISLDIRYVLFVIDMIGNADHLIDEMTIETE
ncbi:MAG TPA: S46 family peptidase [Candidatus Coprenecus avistercoris]|uniref:Dipeptidyl-peptidase n=1 Tax=Candidatus Coprenecus avistercoris TaxID=2840730 RepID=A0A9D1E205_9BACT|nr:S46 family peptidase [Candidatus Coprenecus avistercoris]